MKENIYYFKTFTLQFLYKASYSVPRHHCYHDRSRDNTYSSFENDFHPIWKILHHYESSVSSVLNFRNEGAHTLPWASPLFYFWSRLLLSFINTRNIRLMCLSVLLINRPRFYFYSGWLCTTFTEIQSAKQCRFSNVSLSDLFLSK